MKHMLDFPGAPQFEDAVDLRDMTRVHVPTLVNAIACADVIVAFDAPPANAFTIVHGEATLRELQAKCGSAALTFLAIVVSNDAQADAVAGAKMLGRPLSAPEIAKFGELLLLPTVAIH